MDAVVEVEEDRADVDGWRASRVEEPQPAAMSNATTVTRLIIERNRVAGRSCAAV